MVRNKCIIYFWILLSCPGWFNLTFCHSRPGSTWLLCTVWPVRKVHSYLKLPSLLLYPFPSSVCLPKGHLHPKMNFLLLFSRASANGLENLINSWTWFYKNLKIQKFIEKIWSCLMGSKSPNWTLPATVPTVVDLLAIEHSKRDYNLALLTEPEP